ncbi:uncharacterized protein M421DRAFT_411403 [Didymella exigua CBS 183.55]|uniref:Cytochrome P450 n=1 Tax=Didymella exigua CBS 183.55 TaxID=1150837 RepID=A0A6A5R5Z6_9PLEO|nr:uncharacterized protein M421DRAFT_411403 [Didymella exigua CBS 183.55]KAF1922434.1 hypothetical protein M421DRAFT_411403 [Didymella exigua CBS 183.55]
MIENIVKKRATSDEKHNNALQYMLDQSNRTQKIIKFIVEWLAKAREEVRATAVKHAPNPSAPLRFQLDDVPLEAWEAEFPVVNLCMKDSIRLNLLSTALQKNINCRPLPTDNGMEVILPDAVVTYATANVHQDPSIYPNLLVWDPARYLTDREEDKNGHSACKPKDPPYLRVRVREK